MVDVLGKYHTIFLADQGTVFRRLADAVRPYAVFKLGAVLEAAAARFGTEDRDFGLKELAAFAGMSYDLMYYYTVKRRVLVPSVRDFGGSGKGEGCEGRFSWLDAFTAGAVSTIRRAGLGMKVLRRVQPLFAQVTDEQTDRELAASRAS